MDTPRGDRPTIGLVGRRNAGKTSLFNALLGQAAGIVSDQPGTTTDAHRVNTEWPGVGPVTLIDTAGFDDTGDLGALRVAKTEALAKGLSLAILVFATGDTEELARWQALRAQGPALPVLSQGDKPGRATLAAALSEQIGEAVILVSGQTGQGLDQLRQAVRALLPTEEAIYITGDLVRAGDRVVLVMPQDQAAPKGRLILPQVQTIRELLDRAALPICSTPETLPAALAALQAPPDLMITDSQAFAQVAALCPAETVLTSFSVLFASYKGRADVFAQGAQRLLAQPAPARILIAEACSHTPTSEDIGRVKLPRLLRKKLGEGVHLDIVGGDDFPSDLSPYDLVIHCGACMFTRSYVLARIAACQAAGVPITNYGMAIAGLTGILSQVTLPDGSRLEAPIDKP
ncbi:[FeFe] hydrogenase H-cluster maturation GTPase HydF [Peptococcus simiae]|uniref:[FeFe] hydrogenase H-cluster maturation GTPase HydF n=2 Tax=Peptococcus simiae TaxID=1643805 RepID=A0ABW9H3S3_9FIRM